MNWLAEMPLGIAYRSPRIRCARGRFRSKTMPCTTSCSRIVKLKIVKPCTNGERDPDQRVVETDEPPGGEREQRELPRGHDEVAGGGLPVEVAHLLARDGFAELSP